MKIEHVLVVGAGQMGGGIAQVVAASGRRVSLYDVFPGATDRGLAAMRNSLVRLAEKGGADRDETLGRVSVVDELVPADLMIEAVVEDAATKKSVFGQADEVLPAHAIPGSWVASACREGLAATLLPQWHEPVTARGSVADSDERGDGADAGLLSPLGSRAMKKIPAIDSLRELLESQLARIESCEPGVRDGSDPRDLHRFRVAGRRSRALIRASRKLVGDQLTRVDAELRWLGGVSGPVRDLDVLIEHLRGIVDELAPDQAGGEAILAALEEERLWARESLLEALDSDRYRRLLLIFGAALPALSAIDDDVRLDQLARKEFKRLRTAYGELGPDPPDEELHALRIKAKRARYAAELAELAAGASCASFIDAVTELQDLVGSHQDAVVAEKRVRALASRESQLAAGRIVEHERRRRAEARASLEDVWTRVKGAGKKAFR